VASIYQLDGLVRRAPALQQTADARTGSTPASGADDVVLTMEGAGA
jgi:hypothetical protein